MSAYLMTKFCVSAPTFNLAPPASVPGYGLPVSPTNSFAASASSSALVDSGSQGQSATLSNGAWAYPRGVYFPGSGNPFVQFPSLAFGGADFTIGARAEGARGPHARALAGRGHGPRASCAALALLRGGFKQRRLYPVPVLPARPRSRVGVPPGLHDRFRLRARVAVRRRRRR